MDKAYDPKATEAEIYKLWEQGGYFVPKIDKTKEPFTILLPPPNANADLHLGHAMYVVEDILIRYHRMKGDPTLWLPGADHAGFETQYVYEKALAKEGKSRFDFDRKTLYKNIWDFVHQNRGTMENQLRRLGFSLDWSRNIFTLDPKVVAIVYQTFKKLYDDKLIYRGMRLVNYCTKCGTGFSDLEVKYEERKDPLYYMKYGPFTIATTRPETKFRDTALAVNPKDKRYKKWIGKTLDIQGLLGPITMTVIADPEVDMEFGTGIMKVTPAHDHHDFELGQKYNLPVTPIITFKGRMDFSWFLAKKDIPEKYRARAELYHGKKIAEVRPLMVEHLKEDGLLVKIDENYTHRIGLCYKSGTVIEPLPMQQWFVKVKPLADAVKKAIKEKKITFVPKRFEKLANQWLTNFHDWNISRQIVWGIRIPVWYSVEENPKLKIEFRYEDVTVGGEIQELLQHNPQSAGDYRTFKGNTNRAHDENYHVKNFTLEEIQNGIQSVQAPPESTFVISADAPGNNYLQETDTFDTWFSSGQWPFATLEASPFKGDYEYFYPTSVMETGYDILPWWVCRMAMLGLYRTSRVPFKTVYLHGLVRDAKGQKMSKSKGNVINPLKMADMYGADALRFSLIFGTAAGNDQSLSEDKIRGMRNFANKLWNIGRFIQMNFDAAKAQNITVPFYNEAFHKTLTNPNDKRIITEFNMMKSKVGKYMGNYRLSDAAQTIYDFAWHRIADVHLEKNKERFKAGDPQALAVLRHLYMNILKLLHPFMPFVTEALYQKIEGWDGTPLIISSWP